MMGAVLVLAAVLLMTPAVRGEAPKCERSCRMALEEIASMVDKIRAEVNVDARTDKAEKLVELVEKDPRRPYSSSLVMRVAGLLEDPADSVRYWVATALGFMGPQASGALPQLERALALVKDSSASKTSESAIELAIKRIKEKK
jgi:hypothetical protein